MINDDKNIFDVNILTKLIKAAKNFNNFENYKKLFLYSYHIFL